MKRPMVRLAVPYIFGIAVADAGWLPFWPLLAACAATTALTAVLKVARPIRLLPLLFGLGLANQSYHLYRIPADDLRKQLDDGQQIITLTGRLATTPEHRVSEVNGEEFWRSMVKLAVSEIETDTGRLAVSGTVHVTAPFRLAKRLYAGRQFEVTGVIQRPPVAAATGMFSYRDHLARHGIHFQLRAKTQRDCRLLDEANPPAPPLSVRFQRWARDALAQPLGGDGDVVRLLWAMTLGWRTSLNGEVAKPFMHSGTMHVFAISGLHIAMIAAILVQLMRFIRLPRAACGLLLIPMLWFYVAVTGWQESAVRSSVMVTIVALGWILKRPGDLVNSLAVAAVLILLWEPQQLFLTGFQLSFCVVLTIAMFALPIQERIQNRLQPDPLLPPELWSWGSRFMVRIVTPLLAVSAAAWLGSLPLAASTFNLFTPVTLLVNALIVPLAGVTLAASLGCLICAVWMPFASGLFAHSAWLGMSGMICLSEVAAAFPLGHWYVTAPSAWLMWIYVAALVVWAMPLMLKTKRLGTLALVGLAFVIFAVESLAKRGEFRLTVLPLDSGSALYVEPHDAKPLLIDCGSESGGRFVVVSFLRRSGYDAPPWAVATHGDRHHVQGFSSLAPEIGWPVVFINPTRFNSPYYKAMLDGLEESGRPPVIAARGNSITGWEVLHPTSGGRLPKADDNATVLVREVHGLRLLLLSDLGSAGQADLVGSGLDLRSDIVVASVPGVGEPLGQPLLEAVDPKAIIISAGTYPYAEIPSAALLDRLAKRGLPVFNTLTDGGIELKIRRTGEWQIRSMHGREVTGTKIESTDGVDFRR
ncbi:MAG: ComEC/Rec2 family competence protein [Verrucomicrobiota bacterium]|nr:ComEC/Rec2 family competence protein [Verrucomicrobiota bacterium]